MKKILLATVLMATSATADHLYDPSKIQTREQAAQAGSHVLQDWLTDNGNSWDQVVRRCVHRVPASDLAMQYKCHAYMRTLSDMVDKVMDEKGMEFDSRQHLMLWIGIANSLDGQMQPCPADLTLAQWGQANYEHEAYGIPKTPCESVK